MSGKKVLLTYKRKQPSLTADPARENGKHNLPSGDQETDSQVRCTCCWKCLGGGNRLLL